jgi:hypothetical protein
MHPYSQAVPLAAPVSLYASISHLQSEQVVLPGGDIVLIGQSEQFVPEIASSIVEKELTVDDLYFPVIQKHE